MRALYLYGYGASNLDSLYSIAMYRNPSLCENRAGAGAVSLLRGFDRGPVPYIWIGFAIGCVSALFLDRLGPSIG